MQIEILISFEIFIYLLMIKITAGFELVSKSLWLKIACRLFWWVDERLGLKDRLGQSKKT